MLKMLKKLYNNFRAKCHYIFEKCATSYHASLRSLLGSEINKIFPRRIKGKIVHVFDDNTWEYRDAKNHNATEVRLRMMRRYVKKYLINLKENNPNVLPGYTIEQIQNSYGHFKVQAIADAYILTLTVSDLQAVSTNFISLSDKEQEDLKKKIKQKRHSDLATFVENKIFEERQSMDSQFKFENALEDIAEEEGERKQKELDLLLRLANKNKRND